MQVYKRMRAPVEARPFALQCHVIQAIRRSPEIANGESVYQEALKELLNRSVAEVLDNFNVWTKRLVSEESQGTELNSAIAILDKAYRTVDFSEDYPNVAKFNRDFLNSNGDLALIYSLVIDAADVDTIALDEYRGGEALKAAYGPRQTQTAKREGKRIQSLLKRLASFDEDAMNDAADHYVMYRYLYHGNFTEYKTQMELKGPSFSERHRLKSFNEIDSALGYPAPKRGRPPKRAYPTNPPKDKPLQRKVNRSKGYRRP